MEHIVVGVDGSPHAADALRWAVRESKLRAAELTAVLVWDYLGQHHPDGSTGFHTDFDAAAATRSIDSYVAAALGPEAAGLVHAQAVFGLPAGGLLEASESAALLVLGARGRGGFRELLLGSVSQRCLHEAPCPVAIIRSGPTDAAAGFGRVVVGVDGSSHGSAALDWAAREASLRHAHLRVVHACATNVAGVPFLPSQVSLPEVANKEALALLEHAVSNAQTPDGLVIELVAASGSPAKALLDASHDADLVVVGRAGRSLWTGLVLGSVATQISHHSRIPAVFVSSTDGPVPSGG
ncbi:MAG: universal stress protein [Ilumatobacteraceae bacterium]